MKIVLACAGGMSTSMLVKKMREAAQAKGIDLNVDAYAVSELEEVAPGSDIILLGPQVAYVSERIINAWAPIPVAVIDMMDYGMMNGEKVLNDAIATINKSNRT